MLSYPWDQTYLLSICRCGSAELPSKLLESLSSLALMSTLDRLKAPHRAAFSKSGLWRRRLRLLGKLLASRRWSFLWAQLSILSCPASPIWRARVSHLRAVQVSCKACLFLSLTSLIFFRLPFLFWPSQGGDYKQIQILYCTYVACKKRSESLGLITSVLTFQPAW